MKMKLGKYLYRVSLNSLVVSPNEHVKDLMCFYLLKPNSIVMKDC